MGKIRIPISRMKNIFKYKQIKAKFSILSLFFFLIQQTNQLVQNIREGKSLFTTYFTFLFRFFYFYFSILFDIKKYSISSKLNSLSFGVKPVQIIPIIIYLSYKKNFLNSRQKGISLMKKLSAMPNIPSFSKYFYEYVFLIQNSVFLELPFKK